MVDLGRRSATNTNGLYAQMMARETGCFASLRILPRALSVLAPAQGDA